MKNKIYIIYNKWKIQFISEIIKDFKYFERIEIFII